MKLLNESNIKQIFKGDQNLFWDALILDSSLAYQLNKEKSNIKFIPFIHDEKFGAPDQNLIHCLEKPNDSYFISEDYADSAGDATYLNLDSSFGLFYLPVIEEARLKEFYISVKSLARLFVKLRNDLDQDFIHRCSLFGLSLDSNHFLDQGSGEIPNQEELFCLFDMHPEQLIFYIFTRAIGRYGIAPIKDNNTLLSSIFLNDSNMMETLQNFLNKYLLQGLLDQSIPEDREFIIERFKLVEDACQNTKQRNGSIADLENNISESILQNLKEEFRFHFTKSSAILSNPDSYQINHFYLHSFIENNDLLSEIYNNSLNQTKMSIQRIRKGETTVNLPFYVNHKRENGRILRTELLMNHLTHELLFKNNTDYEIYQKNENSFISGKAIPFLNEFRYGNQLIALPEQGSKYTPACDAFIMNARLKGLLIPKSSILRISLHFLDQLKITNNKILILPRILVPYFGQTITCKQFSDCWRTIAQDIDQLLIYLKEQTGDGKEVYISKHLINEIETQSNQSHSIARYMDHEMLSLLSDLIKEYSFILSERQKKEVNATLHQKYKVVSFKIKLLFRYYMQQLIQVHDGLNYLNDRPYSLAIYLMFGPEFMEELIKNVTFRLESV